MKRAVISIAVLLAALLAAAAAWLLTLDADAFRPQILAEVELRTGRTASLGAPIELDLSLHPVLVLKEFTLGGDGRGQDAPLIRVRRMEAETDLAALARGELTIRRLELDGAELALEAYPDGGASWALSPGTPAEAGGGGADDIRARLARARVTDSRVRYRAADGSAIDLAVERLDLEPADGDQVAFEFRGAVNDVAVEASGRSGRLFELLSPSRAWPIDARASLPGVELTVAGDMREPLSAEGLALAVSLQGPDLAPLAQQLELALPRGLPWSLAGRLGGHPGALEVTELAAVLGNNRVHGTLDISTVDARTRVRGALHAERLDLLQLAGVDSATPASGPRRRVFSEEPFDLAALRALDLDLEVSGESVQTPIGTLVQLLARVTLNDGELAVEPFDARLDRGRVQGSLHLLAPAQGAAPALRLAVDARQLDVARLFQRFGQEPLLEGPADLQASLAGAGASPAAVAGALDGRLRVLMGNGRGRLSMVESLVGGVTKLLGDVGASGDGGWTSVNCLAADFAIRDGIAEREVLLLDTETLTVAGEGTIDLGRERLDLELTPSSKNVTLNLAIAVDVGGTLLEPTFTADTMSAARRVGTLLGGLLFPPAALAAFADLGSFEDHPCGALASQPAAGSAPPKRPATREAPQREQRTAPERLMN